MVRPREDLARECAPSKGLRLREGMEMSQGLSESLGPPTRRVRREFLGIASSGGSSPSTE